MTRRWMKNLLRKIIGRDQEPLIVRYPKGYKENQEAIGECRKSISDYVEARGTPKKKED